MQWSRDCSLVACWRCVAATSTSTVLDLNFETLSRGDVDGGVVQVSPVLTKKEFHSWSVRQHRIT